MLATLIRLLGDFDLAEEALSEAFAAAIEQWPRDGMPANPRAWLVSAGRFKAIDGIRSADAKMAGVRALNAGLWQERIGKIEAFLNAVQALQPAARDRLKQEGGPYADLIAARDSLRTFVAAVNDSAAAVSRWIGEVVFLLPAHRTAAELPVPAGQQQLPVLDDSQLSTSVDLLRARATRSVGDTLRIEYRFYQGEETLGAGWVDTFSLQSYGWQSEVLASLAFAKQDGDATWKPTAAMSWTMGTLSSFDRRTMVSLRPCARHV